MRRVAVIILTLCALQPGWAGSLPRESFSGAVWGAVIGGLAGGDCRDSWSGKGAAIGAGVGFALGSVVGESRRQSAFRSAQAESYSPAPIYGYAPPMAGQPQPGRPNYALGGTLVGAATGAVIGAVTKDKPWEGAAIGAASGLLLGSVAEHNARRLEKPSPVRHHTASASPVPSTKSVWQNQPASPYQIPGAPRVPDAPTF